MYTDINFSRAQYEWWAHMSRYQIIENLLFFFPPSADHVQFRVQQSVLWFARLVHQGTTKAKRRSSGRARRSSRARSGSRGRRTRFGDWDWLKRCTLPILSTIKSLVEFQLCLMAFVVVSVSVQNKLFCMRKVGIAFIYSERLFKHCRYIGGETDRDVTISSKTCPQNMFKHLIYKDTLSIECIVT